MRPRFWPVVTGFPITHMKRLLACCGAKLRADGSANFCDQEFSLANCKQLDFLRDQKLTDKTTEKPGKFHAYSRGASCDGVSRALI